jgi:hypothetical protein
MAAPVRDGIELDAVGELHLVSLFELADLLRAPGLSFGVACVPLLSFFNARVVGKFVLFEVRELVLARRKAPSSNRPLRVLRSVRVRAACVWFRGGMGRRACGGYCEDSWA